MIGINVYQREEKRARLLLSEVAKITGAKDTHEKERQTERGGGEGEKLWRVEWREKETATERVR